MPRGLVPTCCMIRTYNGTIYCGGLTTGNICATIARNCAGKEVNGLPKKPAVNVVPRDDHWAVVRDNAERASGLFRTQAEAIERAKEIAQGTGTELRIQGQDGRWRSVDSYGNDPFPPRDREH